MSWRALPSPPLGCVSDSSATRPRHGLQVALCPLQDPRLILPICLLRSWLMNSTLALSKSVLNDYVPKRHRAKWASLESVHLGRRDPTEIQPSSSRDPAELQPSSSRDSAARPLTGTHPHTCRLGRSRWAALGPDRVPTHVPSHGGAPGGGRALVHAARIVGRRRSRAAQARPREHRGRASRMRGGFLLFRSASSARSRRTARGAPAAGRRNHSECGRPRARMTRQVFEVCEL